MRREGVIRWYSAKGFGFLDPVDGDGSDEQAFYFHLSAVAGHAILKQGQRVTFDPTTSVKGLRAVNVQVIGVETKESKNGSNTNSQ
jgi:cold shock CspA family protein